MAPSTVWSMSVNPSPPAARHRLAPNTNTDRVNNDLDSANFTMRPWCCGCESREVAGLCNLAKHMPAFTTLDPQR